MAAGESTALAQRPQYGRGYGPQPGYYAPPDRYGMQQHDGFFMRLTAGFGYLSASESYGGATDELSGMGATFGAAFGGVVAPNLIVYGELLGTSITNANYAINGVSQGYSGTDLFQFSVGPGIAYYFEPINLYLSGTLTFTKVSFSDTGTGFSQGDTNLGLGASFTVGKEWWVARDWGIGIAGQAHIASMGDTVQGYSTHLQTSVFSLLFSATYN
jgi:hypothetical protein